MSSGTEVFRRHIDLLFGGRSPYDGFPAGRYTTDDQGWNSHHIYLEDTIRRERPAVVLELGVWKGGSTMRMAGVMREEGVEGIVISVDTWLGSWEHWENPEQYRDLLSVFGYPTMYLTFLSNIMANGLQGYVVPLPLDSGNASFVVGRKGIAPDVIHIDAGHDYEAVLADLRRWWPVLKPGGVMIMDDYDPAGVVWPTVRQAVDEFLAATPHQDFEFTPYKCRVRKPL